MRAAIPKQIAGASGGRMYQKLIKAEASGPFPLGPDAFHSGYRNWRPAGSAPGGPERRAVRVAIDGGNRRS
jgi:hypothetical protein